MESMILFFDKFKEQLRKEVYVKALIKHLDL